jgi:hypothetical protein
MHRHPFLGLKMKKKIWKDKTHEISNMNINKNIYESPKERKKE